jgi:hypothetical protein
LIKSENSRFNHIKNRNNHLFLQLKTALLADDKNNPFNKIVCKRLFTALLAGFPFLSIGFHVTITPLCKRLAHNKGVK